MYLSDANAQTPDVPELEEVTVTGSRWPFIIASSVAIIWIVWALRSERKKS